MKRFIAWIKQFFRRNKKVAHVTDEVPFQKKVLSVTSGKRHVWVKTRHGKVRKPIGEVAR